MRNRPWLGRALPAFTLLAALVCVLGYTPFFTQGRWFIWSADGRTQFYPFLLYMGQWLKNGLPAFDFTLGMGEDVLSTFIFMSPCDPLTVLFALLARLGAPELCYDVMALARLYLAGLAFLYFCRERGARPGGAVCAALVYLFCGYALLMANQCSTFTIPMIYLPLLLAGFDRILRGGRPWLFVGAVFYAGITGFYFLYMCSAALAVYGAARGLSLYGRRLLPLARAVGRGIVWYLAGLGLSAPVLVPMVRGYLNSGRTGAGARPEPFWLAGGEEAKGLLSGLFGGPWGFERPGLCAVALAALVLLCCRRGLPALRVVCLGAVALVFCPAFAYLMNGFGYPSWRWTFFLAFVLAWAVAAQWPRLTCVRWYEPLPLVAAGAAYFVMGGSFGLAAGAAMLATAAALWLVRRHPRLVPVLVCVTALNAAGNLWLQNSAAGADYAAEFLFRGEWEERQATPIGQFQTLQQDEGFYRVDQPDARKNASWAEGWQGVAMYNSVLNRCYTDTMLGWELSADTEATYDFTGLDRRAALETLCGVKYMILQSSDTQVPPGFEAVEEQNGWTLYQNRYATPLGVVYPESISAVQTGGFSSVERQQLALRTAALNEAPAAPDPAAGCVYLDSTVELQNARWDNGTLYAEQGAVLTLTTAQDAPGELYLRLNGFATGEYIANVTAECDGVRREARFYNKAHPEYFPTTGATFCFGAREGGACTITVTLDPGYYQLGTVQLWSVPTADYEQTAAARMEQAITLVSRGRDRLTVRTDAAQAGTAVLTIPYSSGWSVTVDGVPAAAQPANGMFLSFPVEAGSHTVTLRYHSPGQRVGLALLALTLLGLAGRLVWNRRRPGR